MSATNPIMTLAGAVSSAGAASPRTAPGPGFAPAPGNVAPPAVSNGTATKYWVELIAYPPASARSLWLLVNNAWKRYDNPPASMSQIVQDAFMGGATVQVWFDGEVIVGLVVNN